MIKLRATDELQQGYFCLFKTLNNYYIYKKVKASYETFIKYF